MLSCLITPWHQQDIEKERRKKENPEAMEEDDIDEVPEIKSAHFE